MRQSSRTASRKKNGKSVDAMVVSGALRVTHKGTQGLQNVVHFTE
jgi:hypothetical protein